MARLSIQANQLVTGDVILRPVGPVWGRVAWVRPAPNGMVRIGLEEDHTVRDFVVEPLSLVYVAERETSR